MMTLKANLGTGFEIPASVDTVGCKYWSRKECIVYSDYSLVDLVCHIPEMMVRLFQVHLHYKHLLDREEDMHPNLLFERHLLNRSLQAFRQHSLASESTLDTWLLRNII